MWRCGAVVRYASRAAAAMREAFATRSRLVASTLARSRRAITGSAPPRALRQPAEPATHRRGSRGAGGSAPAPRTRSAVAVRLASRVNARSTSASLCGAHADDDGVASHRELLVAARQCARRVGRDCDERAGPLPERRPTALARDGAQHLVGGVQPRRRSSGPPHPRHLSRARRVPQGRPRSPKADSCRTDHERRRRLRRW